jgi:hypothetical protein
MYLLHRLRYIFSYLPLFIIIHLASTDEVSDVADPDLAAIESSARKLDDFSFIGDTLLTQTVDKINLISTYSLVSQDGTPMGPMFRRNTNDEGKSIVILTGSDASKSDKPHRVYPILRQSADDPKIYSIFYAYSR